MSTQDVKADPMEGRIARWADIRTKGTAVMFIDSVLPGHYRMNYAVLGDTASENPDYEVAISEPHKFQIGMFEAPPGNGPGWHTHTYVELFMPLTGMWRFTYGDDADDAEDNAVGFAVLDPHEVFEGKDPIWPAWMVAKAAEAGLAADDTGRMVKPDNFAELEAEVTARITRRGER